MLEQLAISSDVLQEKVMEEPKVPGAVLRKAM